MEKIFISQCRKYSAGEALSVSLVSGIETNFDKGGRGGEGVSRSIVESFLSHSAKNFVR